MTPAGALGARLEERLTNRTATIGVVDLGYVGRPLAVALRARGAQLDYADPRVPQVQVGGHLLKSVEWEQADLAAYDLVLLLTAHAEFDPRRLVAEARLVVDTRNATGSLGEHRHVVRI